jgi:hypothetical protein
MSYETLTDNQKAGIDYNAAHNKKSTQQYIQWRLEQDADRGYAEMQAMIAAGLPLPEVVPEPEPELVEEIIEDVSGNGSYLV